MVASEKLKEDYTHRPIVTLQSVTPSATPFRLVPARVDTEWQLSTSGASTHQRKRQTVKYKTDAQSAKSHATRDAYEENQEEQNLELQPLSPQPTPNAYSK